MEPLLIKFYENCLLPEIIDPRRKRSLPIRDPAYIIKAQQEKQEQEKKRKLLNDVSPDTSTQKPFKKRCSKSVNDKRQDDDCNDNNPVTNLSDISAPMNLKDAPQDNIPSQETPTQKPCKKRCLRSPIDERLNVDYSDKNSVTSSCEISALIDPSEETENNVPWVEISDDEDEDREIDELEIIALEAVIASINETEVISEVDDVDNLLTSSSIDLFLRILQQTSDVSVFFSLYFPYQHCVTPSNTTRDLHIIGGNTSRHWFCIYYDGQYLFIYDSLGRMEYERLRPDEKKYISKRYPTLLPDDIIFQPTTLQPDSKSCGVYAAAFATTIALCGDPLRVSQIQYSRNVVNMRNHLKTIIQNKYLSPFPIDSSYSQ